MDKPGDVRSSEEMERPPPYNTLYGTVTNQPIPIQQPMQQPLITFPTGLENLIETGSIRFKQEIQLMQLISCCDMPINFDLINESDQIIYRIQEQENFGARNLIPQGLRTKSSMAMTNGLLALRFSRETRCVMNCCLPCCCYRLPCSKERLTVSSGTGGVYGTVQHDFSAWKSRFSVMNSEGTLVMKIEGPGCNFGLFNDLQYRIVTPCGVEIGSIVKHWHGFPYEAATDFDDFTLNFPRDLDIFVKATLIGAVQLINFLFYQGSLRKILVGMACGLCCLNYCSHFCSYLPFMP